MNSLDNILGGSEAAPEAKQDTTPAPAASEQPAEQATEPTSEGGDPTSDQQEVQTETGRIPFGKLRQAEREKGRKESDAVWERRLAERDQTWERRFNQFVEVAKPKAEPPPPQPPPDIFENAPEAIRHEVRPHLERLEAELRANNIELSKHSARQEYGAELVKEADAAVVDAVRRGVITLEQVQNIPPRELYQRSIQWLQEQKKSAPDYEQKREAELREKHWAEFQEQQNGRPTNGGNGHSPVMPSNLVGARNVGSRNGQAWAGPTALADIFARGRK